MTVGRPETGFGGYVLAGGRSRRMGADKALLPYRDSNLLHHAMGIASTACGRPSKVVVSPHKADMYRKMLSAEAVVEDVFPDMGALGGIHAALADCKSEFVFILAVDLPLVDAGAASVLLRLAAGTADADAVVPEQDDGRLQPLCGAYRVAECLPKLRRLFETQPESSVRDLLARVRTKVVPRESLSPDPCIFRNVNDREAYDSLFLP